MSNPTVLAQLNVVDFFGNANWLGQKSPSNPATSAPVPTTLLRLSLTEFFQRSNWKGSQILVQSEPTPQVLSLTVSVQSFFQYQVWSSTPTVAVVPKAEPLEQKIKPPQNLQLSHLTTLF